MMTFLSDDDYLQPVDSSEAAPPPSSEGDYGYSKPAATARGTSAKRALSFTMFADINPTPKKDFVVQGLIGANETSAFAGAPGSGKSVLAGDLACSIAAGITWHGRRVHKGAVIFVAAERSKLTERRFAAFRRHYNIDDLPLAIVAGAVDFLSNRKHVDEIAAHAAALLDLRGLPVVLIVIDTVSRVLNGGDENSSKDMGALVANVALLQETTGAHVLLIHHIPQDGNVVRLRGHGALLGSLDTVIAVEKAGSIRTAKVLKDNDGIENQQFAFDLESVTLSIDPDTGEETNAPIVISVDGDADRSPANGARPLPKGAQIALRALHQAIDECGAVPAASNHIPAGKKAVTVEQWRGYAYRTGISTSDKANAKRTALSRASDTLVAVQKVGIWDSYVWPIP
jgi:AAA domain